MRMFVAIAPPPAVLDEVESAVAPLRPAWPGLRWTGREAWHVTLAFLGEVGEDTARALGPRLERAAQRHPWLSLSFGAAGARRAGAPPPDEGRRFRPHLTLARCRAPADMAPLVEALAGYSGAPWTAGEIHLIRSYLPTEAGGQPRYEVAGTWPLHSQA